MWMCLRNDKTGICLGVSYMHNRKKPCLAFKEGNVETKLGTFNNEHSAEVFMNVLMAVCGAKDYRVDKTSNYSTQPATKQLPGQTDLFDKFDQ